MYEPAPTEEIPEALITRRGDDSPPEFIVDTWNAQGVTTIASSTTRYRFEHAHRFPFLYAVAVASGAIVEPAEASISRARAFAEAHFASTDGRRSAPRRAA